MKQRQLKANFFCLVWVNGSARHVFFPSAGDRNLVYDAEQGWTDQGPLTAGSASLGPLGAGELVRANSIAYLCGRRTAKGGCVWSAALKLCRCSWQLLRFRTEHSTMPRARTFRRSVSWKARRRQTKPPKPNHLLRHPEPPPA